MTMWVPQLHVMTIALFHMFNQVLTHCTIISAACFRYQREEPFWSLSVDIQNHHNLRESLEQFVKGDFLEGANAYHCDKCNKKVCDSECFVLNYKI